MSPEYTFETKHQKDDPFKKEKKNKKN